MLFKNIEEGDFIYEVTNDGIMTPLQVNKKTTDWYTHTCRMILSNDIIMEDVNLDMSGWFNDDATIEYFANKRDAIANINSIAKDAEMILFNCRNSLNLK